MTDVVFVDGAFWSAVDEDKVFAVDALPLAHIAVESQVAVTQLSFCPHALPGLGVAADDSNQRVVVPTRRHPLVHIDCLEAQLSTNNLQLSQWQEYQSGH